MATATVLGNTAWIGNVIVDRARRQSGLGRELVVEFMERLRKDGVETIMLYAYDRSKSLYDRLGFTFDATVWELSIRRAPEADAGGISRGLIEGIDGYDRSYFVKSRMPVLRHIAGREGAFAASSRTRDGALNGYLLCSPTDTEYGSEIAPFVADKDAVAPLLASLSGTPMPFHTYTPEENLPVLNGLGIAYERVRRVHRGFLGRSEDVPEIDSRVMSVGLLETG